PELAAQIRAFLVESVARTGGHLGPNLGAVEITIALHRVFTSPRDVLIWDTGHQAYVHKLLTGRHDFSQLKQAGGLSGYPSRAESEHDMVENSHASTSLAYADGLAKAFQIRGESSRAVVAVIGDGALTGGMAWEAINNIAGAKERPVIIVVNDNERSYAPTIGGIATHLATLRTTGGYERFLDWGKQVLGRTPVVGAPIYETLHGMKKGLKDVVAPQGMFEDLGLKYIGPIDGHDEPAVEHALRRARSFGGPVLVHCITQKGRGYPPAENDDVDRFHGVGIIDPTTGAPLSVAGPSWTNVFAQELVAVAEDRADVVAISAAMLKSVGLAEFARRFPDRVFDVGIAEQHATTSAAGLAMGGMHPVVAVYASFMNRAYDQVLLDVALHRMPVTFVLVSAGVTGDDGASHNGMWDLSIFQTVPGLRIAAPRDAEQLGEQLREALAVNDGPTMLRFPKGKVGETIPAVARLGVTDVMRRDVESDVLIVAVGPLVMCAMDVAQRLTAQGIGVTVVDPRWVKPVDQSLVDLAGDYRLVVTIEDNLRAGGVGSAIGLALNDAGCDVPLRQFGLPTQFLSHGRRQDVLDACGVAAQSISRAIVETVARWESVSDHVTADPDT
ncbi:MAG: 1-deoxy-D-xylulose-5-phosphate synthase, partial [Candidatus Nanopelagicales bacterium]